MHEQTLELVSGGADMGCCMLCACTLCNAAVRACVRVCVLCWLLSLWSDVESPRLRWWMGVLSRVRSSCVFFAVFPLRVSFSHHRRCMLSERRDAARARSRCWHVRHFGDVREPRAPGPGCTMHIPFWIIMCACLWLADSKIACLLRRHTDMSALELRPQRKRCQGRNWIIFLQTHSRRGDMRINSPLSRLAVWFTDGVLNWKTHSLLPTVPYTDTGPAGISFRRWGERTPFAHHITHAGL